MSKLKLMDYEVVSEMISIGVTPEEYLPLTRSRPVPSLLIRHLMQVGIKEGYVKRCGTAYELKCSESSYNDCLEKFIQDFRKYSPLTQDLIESYILLLEKDK